MRTGAVVAAMAMAITAPAVGAPSVHKVVVRKTISASGEVRTTVTKNPAAEAIVAGCGERRFETSAEIVENGRTRMTRLKLCAKPGEDDATWLKSLHQAAVAIKQSGQLAPASRTKIVADINGEIARVESSAASKASVPAK